MKLLLVLFCAMLTAGSISAQGVYNMAKQQARDVANGGSSQPNEASPASPPPQYNPPPAPSDPALEATLRNINNLRVDFEGFDSNPTNTEPLKIDLAAAAQGAKPSPATVARLAQDLVAVFAGNEKLHPQRQKLAQYIHAVFNGSHLSPAQQQMVCDGVQKCLSDGGVTSDDSANVINDLKAIANETK